MVDFAEHRKALLCNDAASIADYESAMDQATKAVASRNCVAQLRSILLKKAWAYRNL